MDAKYHIWNVGKTAVLSISYVVRVVGMRMGGWDDVND